MKVKRYDCYEFEHVEATDGTWVLTVDHEAAIAAKDAALDACIEMGKLWCETCDWSENECEKSCDYGKALAAARKAREA